jgi:hypothetical protein
MEEGIANLNETPVFYDIDDKMKLTNTSDSKALKDNKSSSAKLQTLRVGIYLSQQPYPQDPFP